MNIFDLKVGQRAVIKAKIIEKGTVREFNKFGRVGRVCECVLEDESGKIKLVLWDEQIDQFNEGENIEIAGYVKEYKGERQLNLFREGFS